MPGSAAILDIDGTLVDTNYHHALTWFEAFRQHGFVVPVWRIHRTVGMGADNLVPRLIGEEADEEHGADVRAAEGALYAQLIAEVEPLAGARDLISELKDRGKTIILASSAKQSELDHYLDLLDARDLADDWTSSADVETTKPAPDLVEAALKKAGTDEAAMLGDTPWDIEAAGKANVPCVGLMTGGFAEAELRDAGAVAVFESLEKLREGLDETPLG